MRTVLLPLREVGDPVRSVQGQLHGGSLTSASRAPVARSRPTAQAHDRGKPRDGPVLVAEVRADVRGGNPSEAGSEPALGLLLALAPRRGLWSTPQFPTSSTPSATLQADRSTTCIAPLLSLSGGRSVPPGIGRSCRGDPVTDDLPRAFPAGQGPSRRAAPRREGDGGGRYIGRGDKAPGLRDGSSRFADDESARQ